MKTIAVTAHAHQLTRFGFINCYLVREEDGFTLVDAGLFASSAGPILAAARALGAPIRRIVLTHAHTDHVGAVDALVSELGSQVEVACSVRSLRLLATPPDKTPVQGEPPGTVRGGLPGIKTRPRKMLGEGDRYGSLLCIATPGHIPGQLAFLDERDGTLYAGDTFIAMGRLAIPGYAPWYFALPNGSTWNKALAIESARKLRSLPIERFACGHGGVKPGGLAALEAAILKATS